MARAVGHGKIILFGEHSVVHGSAAVAMALSLGATASAEAAVLDSLEVQPFGTRLTPGSEPPAEHEALLRAFEAVMSETPEDRVPLAVRAELQVPAGAGLGASAALGVAIVRAVDSAVGRTRSMESLMLASLAWEEKFHGNPSGVDSAMAVHGGIACFRRGGLPMQINAAAALPLVVGHSGTAPSTRIMVERVAEQLKSDPARVEGIFGSLEAIVEDGRAALEVGNLPQLGRLMTRSQGLLRRLRLSTPRLENLCREAELAGALGAKLTGGGGGGCMIALAPDLKVAERIRERLCRVPGTVAFVATPEGSAAAMKEIYVPRPQVEVLCPRR